MNHHQLEIANHFFWDCFDLYQRYLLSIDKLYVRKSGRLKCFIDLRIAYECILKASVVYFETSDKSKKNLIKMVEKYSHHTDKLEKDVIQYLPDDLKTEIEFFSKDIKKLPISLRYRLDTMDYIDALEEEYYKTVGQEHWLDRFAELVGNLNEYINTQLQSHSRVVSLYDVFEPGELLKQDYNKYDWQREKMKSEKLQKEIKES
nr:hypothetical protein [uncultured Desulfobacter sp.]